MGYRSKKTWEHNDGTRVTSRRKWIAERGECASKKDERTPIEGGKRERRETEIIQEWKVAFPLEILLKVIKLARSTYYSILKLE